MVPGGLLGLFAAALLGASTVVCSLVLLHGWRRRQCMLARDMRPRADPLSPVILPFALGRTPFVGAMLDLSAEVRDVLERLSGDAAQSLVQLEMAVPPDLWVHTDALALRTVLAALAGRAVRQARGGMVLVSAVRQGGRVQIAVTDDGAGVPAPVQEAALREVAQLVALQGGTLEIDALPGVGTTVVVRLPEPMLAGAAAARLPDGQPAEPAARPRPAVQPEVVEVSWDI